jgi:hypothetical protein
MNAVHGWPWTGSPGVDPTCYLWTWLLRTRRIGCIGYLNRAGLPRSLETFFDGPQTARGGDVAEGDQAGPCQWIGRSSRFVHARSLVHCRSLDPSALDLPAAFFPLHLDWRSALGRLIRVKAAYPHQFLYSQIGLALTRISRPIRSASGVEGANANTRRGSISPVSNSQFSSEASNISGGAFSRLFEFQSLVLLAGTVSFTHAVAALIRCFALSTVAR